MTWIVDEFTLQEVMDRSRDDDPFHVFSEDQEGAAGQISHSLSGGSRGHREALRDRVGYTRTRFDRTTALLLAHAGLDPLALAVLGEIGDEVYVRDARHPDHVAACLEGRESGFVRLSPAVVWQFDTELTVDGLPETVALALRGRPLSAAVSHPVLDARPDLVIRSLRREAFGPNTYTHLRTGDRGLVLNGHDLFDIDVRQMEAA